MITIGIDPHKRSHTAVAVNSATGELCDQLTIASDQAGHERLSTSSCTGWTRSTYTYRTPDYRNGSEAEGAPKGAQPT